MGLRFTYFFTTMGVEQSTFAQAAEACRCDCDIRKDDTSGQQQRRVPVGTATPRGGFQGFEQVPRIKKPDYGGQNVLHKSKIAPSLLS